MPAEHAAPGPLATVEQLLLAHRLAPEETLAVRLLGTVGPDGSWALDRVDVVRVPGEVRIVPQVRRVPGDFFIQMVMPLDHALDLPPLAAGRHRIVVEHTGGALADTVVVATGVRRPGPEVHLQAAPGAMAGTELVVPVQVEARAADGFVERVEWRDGDGPWRAPEFSRRDGAGLQAGFTVRRPAGDEARRLAARVVDGQRSAATATLVLPAR